MKIQTTAAAALLGAAAIAFQTQAGEAVQWRVEDGGNGHWYAGTQLPDGSSPANWWDAASLYCGARGGHLATPTSASENDFIVANAVTQIPPQSGFGRGPMLGGRLETNGWQWVDGEPWSYSGWCGPEPTGDGIHLQYWAFSYLCWNDFPGADAVTNTLIVEWSADCNSDGIVDYGQCRDGTLPDYNGNNIPDCCEQGVQCTVGNYPVQWRVEDGGNGHWYQVAADQISFDSQQSTAAARGAMVVCVADAEENAFVYRLARARVLPAVWIGMIQDPAGSEPDGGWHWIDGSTSSWRNWGAGEPNNWQYDEDSCVMIVTPAPQDEPYWLSRWQDYPAFWQIPSVIEWSADCNNDSIVDYGQILNGTLADTNTNGVPDICEGRLTIRVPADQPTIQAAIDAAPLNTQCIVAVSAGTYAGPIDFKGKSVIVRGAGASQTIISGAAGSTLSVVRFTGGEPAFAALEKVSIRGGVTGSPFPGSPQFQVGGGLFAYNSAASVRDCVFENNTAAFGGGAYVWNCTGSIERCTFRNNRAGADGAGIQLYRGSPTVVDTIVENNTANSRGGGMHIVDGTPHLVRTVVRNNISSNVVGGVSWVPAGNTAAFLSFDGCNVTGNTAAVVQGGIGSLEDGATTKVSLHGTSVCGNLPRPNVAGRFNDLGGNVICDCTGDLNLDGVVNGADLGLMLSSWGPCGSSCPYDLNVDGVVNGADLGLMLSAWGTCGS
jgi:hypothetical protein